MKISNCAEDQTRPLSLQNRSRCSPTTLRSKALKNAAVRRRCTAKRAAAETAADDGVAGETAPGTLKTEGTPPANFRGLVLGCIEAKFCKKKNAFENPRRDLQNAFLCRSMQISKIAFFFKKCSNFALNIAEKCENVQKFKILLNFKTC